MSTSTDPVPDIICDVCDALRKTGRRTTSDPVHCRHCHNTWTGNEAQHCTLCHRTFSAIGAAEHHRYRRLPNGRNEDRCLDPATTPGWREKRPGVWTDSERASAWFQQHGDPT